MSDHNKFYRDHYRRTISVLLVFSVVAVALSLILGLMSLTRKQPKYYATTTSGIIVPLHSLSEPVITQKYLLQWAEIAARTALNLDFVNYGSQLKRAKPFFTSGGWSSFNKALKSSNMLATVIDQKVRMSAVVSGAPVIQSQAIVHSRYTWRIQMPLLITFNSASQESKMRVVVTMNISRVPVLGSPQGIQISDFAASSKI